MNKQICATRILFNKQRLHNICICTQACQNTNTAIHMLKQIDFICSNIFLLLWEDFYNLQKAYITNGKHTAATVLTGLLD